MRTSIALLMAIAAAGLHAQTVITGKLLGHDDRPMVMTNIHSTSHQKSAATGHADKDGTFVVITKDTGLVTVKFAGLFHMSEDITFLIERPETIRVDIRLGTYLFNKPLPDLRLVLPQTTMEMKRQNDGRYMAVVQSKEKVAYEISGAEASGRNINGTQAESYLYDGDGDYRSIVTPTKGKVRIVYDSTKLLQSKVQPRLNFANPESKAAKCAEAFWAINMGNRKAPVYRQAFLEDDAKSSSGLLARLTERTRTEADPRVRGLAFVGYLCIKGSNADTVITSEFLKSIGRIARDYPRDRLYELAEPFLSACRRLRFGEECKRAFTQLLDSLSDADAKANTTMSILSMLESAGDQNQVREYYDIALNRLTGHPYWSFIKEQFGPAGGFVVGQKLPPFAARSLSDTSVTLTNATFLGKVFLIDLWATWNSASLDERGNLHRVYEKFKSPKFEILSLSLDTNPDVVEKFREKNWKMPWQHALITTDKNMLTAFPTLAVPDPVLIDTAGTIIALKEQLIGAELEKTLSKVIGNN